MGSFTVIKIEANIDERIHKLARRLLGLVNIGGADAIVALCEDLDFLEPVVENLSDLVSVKDQLKTKQRVSKEKSQVKAAILAGGDNALLELEETIKKVKEERGL